MKLKLPDTSNFTVLKNIISLGFLQISNYVFPLLTIPYLTRTVGLEYFGWIFLAQSLISNFVIFTDYGFNLTATRDISIHRGNIKKTSEIFSAVYILKLSLFLIGLLIYFAIITLVPKFFTHFYLFLFSFLMVLSHILTPTWFFQGIEKMKILTILNAIAKTINFILIVTLIKDPDDFIFANIFFAAGGIICGIIAFIYIIKKHQLKFYIPGRLRLIYYLKDGWATFASNFSINIHFNASVIILGLFASPLIVGLYTLSERITFVIRTYLSVFFQAIFPRISHLSRISHDSVKTQFRSIYFYFLISVTGICLLTFTFSQEILFFLGETNSESANNYLKILVWGPLITSLNIPFFQVMLVYNLKNDYLKVYALGAILNIILNFVLVNLFSAYGSCAAIVVTDLFITAGLIYSLEYKNKNYSLMSIYKVKPF